MRRRAALLTLLLLVGIIAVPVVLTWRQVRQEQLNHALIAAVDRNDSANVRRLLRQGADPNAWVLAQDRHSIWRRLLDRFQHGSASTLTPHIPILARAIEWQPPSDTADFDRVFHDRTTTVKALIDAGPTSIVSIKLSSLTIPLVLQATARRQSLMRRNKGIGKRSRYCWITMST